jgi:surface carbohydrate biosynthesis protein (TIGR04326 family)
LDSGSQILRLWDAATTSLPADHPPVLLWSGAASRPGDRSLAALLEQHADEVRARFLAWTHEFGELRLGACRLREYFAGGQGRSFWAHGLFFEQSAWRQPSLEPLLKVMALLVVVNAERPARMEYAGADHALAKVLATLCERRGIVFSRRDAQRARLVSTDSAHKRLPNLLQGLLALGWLAVTRLRLHRPVVRTEQRGRRVMLIGPLFNYDVSPEGRFESRFWTKLPQALGEGGLEVTWLHYFYAKDAVGSTTGAQRLLARLNLDERNGRHALVDAYMTLGGFARVAGRWLFNIWRSYVAGARLSARFASHPEESFWPLVRADFGKTFRGTSCIENLFFMEAFDRALRAIPHQDEGLYLMENQGWERALARAWRKHGHGRLAGVAHSTLRFWDLRYHADPRRYRELDVEAFPRPAVVVLNGAAARESYGATAPERETVVECEALRYLHLPTGTPPAVRPRPPGELHLLVLGDYVPARTSAMIDLVAAAACAFGQETRLRIFVKPHPSSPVDPARWPTLDLSLVEGSAAALATRYDLVLASNTTSASVDAYVGGGRVIVHDDFNGVNYSPLRGVAGVAFVGDAARLCEELRASLEPERGAAAGRGGMVDVDPRLTRWKNYLNIAEGPLPT